MAGPGTGAVVAVAATPVGVPVPVPWYIVPRLYPCCGVFFGLTLYFRPIVDDTKNMNATQTDATLARNKANRLTNGHTTTPGVTFSLNLANTAYNNANWAEAARHYNDATDFATGTKTYTENGDTIVIGWDTLRNTLGAPEGNIKTHLLPGRS